MNNSNINDRIFAALATAVVTFLILLILFVTDVGGARSLLAAASIPEEPADEDIYIDPEPEELKALVSPSSEPEKEVAKQEEAEPQPAGAPEPAPEDQPKRVVPGNNPEPAPKTPKLVSQTQPSPVKTTAPPKEEKPESKVSSKMADKFSPKNGSYDGKEGTAGTGKTGTQTVGKLNGRSFRGCSLPHVRLKQKVVVTVAVVVDASGKVIEATYRSGTADASIRNACVSSARTARWSEKPGASAEKGTITFTIIPDI